MKNNLDRYPHSVTSHNHWKFKTLRRSYGWAGEGKFWALNNMIADASDCVINLNDPVRKAAVAAEIDFDVPELEEYILFLAEKCQLIVIEKGMITTEKVQETFSFVDEKRVRDRNRKLENSTRKSEFSARKVEDSTRKSDNSDKVAVENEQSKVNESKVKKSKVKEITPNGVGEAAASPSSLQDEYKGLEKDKRIVYEFIRDKKPDFIEPYVELWNIFAAEKSLPKVSKINNARKRKFKVRMNESGFDFPAILKKAATSEFLLTGNWFGFDWIIQNDTNFLKILEGKYDAKTNQQIAAVKKSVAPEEPKSKSMMGQLDYLWGRFQENQLMPEVIPPEIYDLIVSRGLVPVGFMNDTDQPLSDGDKRAAVMEFFHLKSKMNETRATA